MRSVVMIGAVRPYDCRWCLPRDETSHTYRVGNTQCLAKVSNPAHSSLEGQVGREGYLVISTILSTFVDNLVELKCWTVLLELYVEI